MGRLPPHTRFGMRAWAAGLRPSAFSAALFRDFAAAAASRGRARSRRGGRPPGRFAPRALRGRPSVFRGASLRSATPSPLPLRGFPVRARPLAAFGVALAAVPAVCALRRAVARRPLRRGGRPVLPRPPCPGAMLPPGGRAPRFARGFWSLRAPRGFGSARLRACFPLSPGCVACSAPAVWVLPCLPPAPAAPAGGSRGARGLRPGGSRPRPCRGSPLDPAASALPARRSPIIGGRLKASPWRASPGLDPPPSFFVRRA